MTWRPLTIVLAAVSLWACSSATGPAQPAPPPHSRAQVAEGGMCGGIAGFQCGEGLTCTTQPGQCRKVADASGVCRKRPQVCTMIYAPVCGCDGKTYPSACGAAAQGAAIATSGECKA